MTVPKRGPFNKRDRRWKEPFERGENFQRYVVMADGVPGGRDYCCRGSRSLYGSPGNARWRSEIGWGREGQTP